MKMKIAVCEDNAVDLKIISGILNEYLKTSSVKFTFDVFETFDGCENNQEDYDLFILDYMMPGKNGLDFARELYDKFKTSKTVIFITAYPEIVYDSFEVNTFRFLVKPLDKNKVFKALDDFFNNLPDDKLMVKVDGKKFLLDLSRVIYFESQGRKIIAHMINSEPVVFYSKTSDLENSLDNSCFFRVHRSYTVRLDKVKSFNCDSITTVNDIKVSMSPKRYYDFCEAYLKNIKRRYL